MTMTTGRVRCRCRSSENGVSRRVRCVRVQPDPSLVSHRHPVGYYRSPGNLAPRVTRSIGERRMSLWSTMVVKLPGSRLRRRLAGSAATLQVSDQVKALVGVWFTLTGYADYK